MSHEIDNSLGFDAFVRAAGTKEAWHGLGQQVDANASLEVRLEAAGANWECVKTRSQYMFAGELRDSDDWHNVRSDTGVSLGVFSEHYKVHQPREIFETFDNLIEVDDRFQFDTAGVLKQGRVIFTTAKFSQEIEAAGDKHVAHLLATTSFDGTMATILQGTMTRVVCNNTLTASLWDKSNRIAVRHNAHWNEAAQAKAQDKLLAVIAQFGQYKVMADAMALVRMSKENTEDMLLKIFCGADKMVAREDMTTNARNQYDALFQSYIDTVEEGTQAGTVWTALNAVTRYVDHGRTVRDTSGEGSAMARMSSANFGSGAALKGRALEMLADYAGIDMKALASA